MEKIDLHLHLMETEFTLPSGVVLSGPREMLPHMDRLGIRKAVLMSGCKALFPAASNQVVQKICRTYPDRYAWMCNLDPCRPEEVFPQLQKYRDLGAIGIGELACNRRLDDPFLQALFAAAQALELPVTFHLSPETGRGYGVVDDPGLPLLEQVLKAYPNLKLLGHSKTFWNEISGDAPRDLESRRRTCKGPVVPGGRISQLLAAYPNLYCDLSAQSGSNALMRDPEFGLSFLEQWSDRLFFATDMLNTQTVFPLGPWLDQQAALGQLSQQAYENVCAWNAQRVFGL